MGFHVGNYTVPVPWIPHPTGLNSDPADGVFFPTSVVFRMRSSVSTCGEGLASFKNEPVSHEKKNGLTFHEIQVG